MMDGERRGISTLTIVIAVAAVALVVLLVYMFAGGGGDGYYGGKRTVPKGPPGEIIGGKAGQNSNGGSAVQPE
jgi:hypothetical protein